MKVIGNLGQTTVNHVIDNINRKLAHTTVAITMEIWLAAVLYRGGRIFLYWLLVEETEITHSMLNHIFERLFDNSAEKLVNTLLEAKPTNQEEQTAWCSWFQTLSLKGRKMNKQILTARYWLAPSSGCHLVGEPETEKRTHDFPSSMDTALN